MTDGKLHHRTPDLTGRTYGALTVVSPAHTDGRKRFWRMRCLCGQEVVRVPGEMRKLRMANCGCMTKHLQRRARQTHGMSRHPAYFVWRSMVDRCTLPTHQAWRNYGGRGITVCDEWRESFEAFWRDMGPTYSRGLELDRRDNEAGYTAANCRWVPRRVQANNRRGNIRILTPDGEMTVAQASQRYGVGKTTILYRLANDWPTSKLLIPPHPANRGFSTS